MKVTGAGTFSWGGRHRPAIATYREETSQSVTNLNPYFLRVCRKRVGLIVGKFCDDGRVGTGFDDDLGIPLVTVVAGADVAVELVVSHHEFDRPENADLARRVARTALKVADTVGGG